MDSSGIAPESSVCRTDVFLLDHEPECSSPASGSRGTRTHKRDVPAACFQDRFLIQSDDFRRNLPNARVGIEPTTSWFRARRHYQQQLPRSVVSNRETQLSVKRFANWIGEESNLSNRDWFKGRRPTISRSYLRSIEECPAGIEPACPGWKPSTFAARSRARVFHQGGKLGTEGVEPHKAVTLGTRLSNRLLMSSQLACPSVKLRRQESNLCRDG